MTDSCGCSSPLCRRLLGADDADALLFACPVAELDFPGCRGEEGVITPHSDVLPGIEGASPLTDDDRAGIDLLSIASLDAQALPIGVAAVLAGASSLLVSHRSLLLVLRLGCPPGSRLADLSGRRGGLGGPGGRGIRRRSLGRLGCGLRG